MELIALLVGNNFEIKINKYIIANYLSGILSITPKKNDGNLGHVVGKT
jgi:hypothetical protein